MPSKKCKSRSQTQRFELELELESRGMPLPGTNAETTENRKIHIMPSTPSHLWMERGIKMTDLGFHLKDGTILEKQPKSK